jgi:hypothetical protein
MAIVSPLARGLQGLGSFGTEAEKRRRKMDDYEVEDGRIVSHGKFEQFPEWSPYLADLGFEFVRISASLLAGASAHEADGRPALAESIRRTVEAYSAAEQSKLATEASIRRAVRDVSRW